MRNEIIYTDEPMELGEVVEDFLPSPEELIAKKKVKITLELTEETIHFLKAEAANLSSVLGVRSSELGFFL